MDKGRATWLISYAYLAYLFFGQLPWLSGLPLFSVQASFILLVLLYLFSSTFNWGIESATKFLVLTYLTSYAVEYLGVQTGVPFGSYGYTSAMGPMVGPVPLFIPFIWSALGYFCLQAAGPSVVTPAALMAVIDVSLDPIFSRTLWHWHATVGPAYYGVPLLNFFGWFLTSLLIFAIFRLAFSENRKTRPRAVLYSSGSAEGVVFFLFFGLATVVFLVRSGLGPAAAVSALLYAVSAATLWALRSRGWAGTEYPDGSGKTLWPRDSRLVARRGRPGAKRIYLPTGVVPTRDNHPPP